MPYQPKDCLSETFEDLLQGYCNFLDIFVNQGWREAWVLARLDGRILIEYTMPRGSTSLRFIWRDTAGLLRFRNIAYDNVPTVWLQEMVDNRVWWNGTPQQSYLAARSAEELLYERKG